MLSCLLVCITGFNGTPYFSNPPLTGTGAAPLTVTSGDAFTYQITETDMDRPGLDGRNGVDFSSSMNGSFNSGVFPQGISWTTPDATGKRIYTLVGFAATVTQPAVYMDYMRLYNDRSTSDPYCDNPFDLQQVVIVKPKPPGGTGHAAEVPPKKNGQTPFTPKLAPNLQNDKSPLRLGQTLKDALLPDFKWQGITTEGVAGTSVLTQKDVSAAYLPKVKQLILARAKLANKWLKSVGQIDLKTLDTVKIRLLPKPSTDLGFEGRLKDGRPIYF